MSESNDDKAEFVSRVPLFSDLAPDEIAKLVKIAVARRYPRNATIFHEGDRADALYILQQGQVKILLTDVNGRETIVSTLRAGECFGEMALIDSEERCAQVVTMAPCQLLVIASSEFRRLLGESPELSIALLRQLSERLRQANRNIGSLATLDVLGRVARLLIEYAQEEEGELIVRDLPTQRDIAAMVGASREMVNRVFQHLTRNGYLESRLGGWVLRESIEDTFTEH